MLLSPAPQSHKSTLSSRAKQGVERPISLRKTSLDPAIGVLRLGRDLFVASSLRMTNHVSRGALGAPSRKPSCYLPILRLAATFGPLAKDDTCWARTPSETASLLFVHVHVLGVDYALVFLLLRTAGGLSVSARSRAARWRLLCRGRLVHRLSQLVRSLCQTIARDVHRSRVAALERFLRVGQSVFNVRTLLPGDLVSVLAQHFLDAVHHAVELVARFHFLALGLVFGSVGVCVLRHALDFFLAQARRRRDRNLLVLARGHVLGVHVQDAVSVDVERDFDLR